jgi:hypothetical protein
MRHWGCYLSNGRKRGRVLSVSWRVDVRLCMKTESRREIVHTEIRAGNAWSTGHLFRRARNGRALAFVLLHYLVEVVQGVAFVSVIRWRVPRVRGKLPFSPGRERSVALSWSSLARSGSGLAWSGGRKLEEIRERDRRAGICARDVRAGGGWHTLKKGRGGHGRHM